jgi:hypothetical protein
LQVCQWSRLDELVDTDLLVGAAGLLVGQPFDVVKVRYQTPQYSGRYGSTFGALSKCEWDAICKWLIQPAAILKEEKVGPVSQMTGRY